jgi:hypothetical protein
MLSIGATAACAVLMWLITVLYKKVANGKTMADRLPKPENDQWNEKASRPRCGVNRSTYCQLAESMHSVAADI